MGKDDSDDDDEKEDEPTNGDISVDEHAAQVSMERSKEDAEQTEKMIEDNGKKRTYLRETAQQQAEKVGDIASAESL